VGSHAWARHTEGGLKHSCISLGQYQLSASNLQISTNRGKAELLPPDSKRIGLELQAILDRLARFGEISGPFTAED
jgi:hypothetical protein